MNISLKNGAENGSTIIHILWDGDFGGIQRIVKNVFLDDKGSPFRHVSILAGHFGPLIGSGPNRFCLGMKNGFDIIAFLRLNKIFRNFPDAVFVYHLDTPIFRFLFRKNGPMLYFEHGCTAKRDKFRIINKFIGGRFFCHAEKIICISKQIQGEITSLYPQFVSKTSVIGNPVTIPFGKPRKSHRNPPVIAFIGRFSPEKGPKEFIQCASLLFNKNPLLKFKMIGDGPLLSECKEIARQTGIPIDFTGAINAIAEELETIDVVAVSSRKDAFNMVVVEAMARGVPVASFPVGGIPEIITDNVTGLLSDSREPESLARSIESILNEENLYAKLSANAFLNAQKNYSLEAYQKKWNEMFHSIT